MMRGFLLAGLVGAAGCDFPGTDSFFCTGAAECVLGGVQGFCERTGFCSFPDSSCASNRRYGQYAGPGLAGACVGASDGGIDAPALDGDPDGPVPLMNVAHVPPLASYGGWADLDLRGSVTITTGPMAPTIASTEAIPTGVVLDTSPQECPPNAGPCPELALLHVRALSVAQGADVRIEGSRPLVVLADRDIRIDGLLDGSAAHEMPGAGGEGPTAGLGAGVTGAFAGAGCPVVYNTSGGGGAGHATAGGDGGNSPNVVGGRGGNMYGDLTLTTLRGGSGGGSGGLIGGGTPGKGGAGGGGLQLYSATGIHILTMGGINLGGGGGAGGNGNFGGNGGGSGGSLVLQAPVVSNAGTLAVNGGGGGSGFSNPGQDAMLGLAVATGGAALGPGAAGGAGGAGNGAIGVSLPFRGADYGGNGGFGGGGGGAFGRIRALVSPAPGSFSDTGTISPDPSVGPF